MASADQLISVLIKAGKYSDALNLIHQGLQRDPTNADLFHNKGACLEGLSDTTGSFTAYMQALTHNPDHLDSLIAVGHLYKSKALLNEALEMYEKALKLAEDDQPLRLSIAAVLTDLGTHLKNAGKMKECVQKYEEAKEYCQDYAPAHYNLGVVCSEARDFTTALEHYCKAIELQPHYGQALCNIGVLLKEQGKLEEAVASYEKALTTTPNYTVVANNLAIALTDLGTKYKLDGKVEEGIALYEQALRYNPKYSDAMYNLGVAYGETGRLDSAMFMYNMAVNFNPNCAEAYNNLGVLYKEKDLLEKAVECYQAALQIRFNFPQSLNNLGVIYTAQGKTSEALALLQAAINSNPDYAEAYNNLGVLQRDVGAIQEALESYQKCLEHSPRNRNASQNRLLALNYKYPGEDEMVCEEHRKWGEEFQNQFVPLEPLPSEWAPLMGGHGQPATSGDSISCDPEPPHTPDTSTDVGTRPLRVGYISPDLFTHSVSYFAEAPLSHHNPSRVTVLVYNCTPKADAKTARLKKAVEKLGGTWREVHRLSEPDLARVIREDRVDVLVELTGHTANNRLGVMAMKPSPVQVTWIGYPNSTGLKAVQYRFTDAVCDPENTTQTFVEELVRLPGCFLCYTPALEAPAVAPLPALRNGFVTFGSFNNLAKITKEVVATWADILKHLPGSRLVVKNKPFACEAAKAHVMAMFATEGVESWRVDLLPLQGATQDHLALYSMMDISLDTFPYAGTTTTCESLYMGVPVVTLAGRCHAQNVSVSLLSAVGMEKDWVAHSREEYVQLAVERVSDLPALSEVRNHLRQRMLTSPLCNAQRFVDKLEDVYVDLFQRWWNEGTQQEVLPAEVDMQNTKLWGSTCMGESSRGDMLLVDARPAGNQYVSESVKREDEGGGVRDGEGFGGWQERGSTEDRDTTVLPGEAGRGLRGGAGQSLQSTLVNTRLDQQNPAPEEAALASSIVATSSVADPGDSSTTQSNKPGHHTRQFSTATDSARRVMTKFDHSPSKFDQAI